MAKPKPKRARTWLKCVKSDIGHVSEGYPYTIIHKPHFTPPVFLLDSRCVGIFQWRCSLTSSCAIWREEIQAAFLYVWRNGKFTVTQTRRWSTLTHFYFTLILPKWPHRGQQARKAINSASLEMSFPSPHQPHCSGCISIPRGVFWERILQKRYTSVPDTRASVWPQCSIGS